MLILPIGILDSLSSLCFNLAQSETDANQLAGEMLMAAADYLADHGSSKGRRSGRTMDPLLAVLESRNEQIQPSR